MTSAATPHLDDDDDDDFDDGDGDVEQDDLLCLTTEVTVCNCLNSELLTLARGSMVSNPTK